MQMRLATLVFTLAAASLQAQGVRFGLQATLAHPFGDLSHGDHRGADLGYGLGLHCQVDLGDGHAIVPRIDCTRFEHTKDMAGLADAPTSLLTVGADYTYALSGQTNQGVNLLLGAGYARTASNGGYYLQTGLGYQITKHLGTELRYQYAAIETWQAKRNMPSLQATVNVRF